MIDYGVVMPGRTVRYLFGSYDGATGASETLSGLAVGDIEIYKDGSTTQRAGGDAGITLLDTDGIDFDGVTGINGFAIDLSNDSDAGFYAAGSEYLVVIASVTIDGQTVNLPAFRFTIGYPDAWLNTSIATLSSQTSFTLTSGPAEDDALNGQWCVIHDVASAVQKGYAIVLDYTGATKTVTLAAATTFTVAATDNFALMGPAPLQPTTIGRSLDVTATGAAGLDWGNVENATTTVGLSGTTVKTATDVETDTADIQTRIPAALVGGRIDANVGAISSDATAADNAEAFFDGTGYAGTNNVIPTVTTVTTVDGIAANAITASAIATDALGSVELATTAVDEIVDAVWDEARAGHVTAGTFGEYVLADAVRVSGDATAADRLEALMDGLIVAQVNGAATTTSIPADGFTEATNDHFNGRLITFLTGALTGQQTSISDYVGGTQTFTVVALTEAPADNDFFVVH